MRVSTYPTKNTPTLFKLRLGKALLLTLLASCMLGSVMPTLAQTTDKTSEAASPENLYQQAYQFAVAKDFVQAIGIMAQIPASAIHYEAAQKKIVEWKKILVSSGTTYEKELARREYDDAYFWANKGHFVRAVHEMKKILPASPFYKQAQQKIELWTRMAEASGPSLIQSLDRYLKQFDQAYQLSQTGEFERAVFAMKRIQEDSPYHPKAEAYVQEWEKVLAEKAQEMATPVPSPTPSQVEKRKAVAVLPSWDISLQNRYGIPLGSELSPALGLGLSWYPLNRFGLHAEGNLFLTENYLALFFPLTLRFSPLVGQNWRTYMGVGGFVLSVDKELPVGAMLELGGDWWFSPHFGLGAGIDYGLSLSPKLSHTLGLQFQLKAGW